MLKKIIFKISFAFLLAAFVFARPLCVSAEEGENSEEYLFEDNGADQLCISPDELRDVLDEEDDWFEIYAERAMYGVSEASVFAISASEYMSEYSARIKAVLEEKISLIADGEVTSSVVEIATDDMGDIFAQYSAADLGTELVTDGKVNREAVNKYKEKIGFAFAKIVYSLFAEEPFNMYWENKTESIYASDFTYVVKVVDGIQKITVKQGSKMVFTFPVSGDYADKSKPLSSHGSYVYVDPSHIERVYTARDNALEIIADAEDYSDTAKLLAYKNRIRELVTYDSSAAGGDYGDAFQLINVFDGDENTNVVCEGYSKAFKYLCDLTEFQKDIYCLCVQGMLYGGSSGSHMWNIVDVCGENYLVDVTNDQCKGLFMQVPASGGVTSGYVFATSAGNLTYKYSIYSTEIYTENELKLSEKPYFGGLELSKASLGLGNNITVTFKTPQKQVSGYDRVYLDVEMNENEFTLSSSGQQVIDGEEYLIFDIRNISAKNMADDLNVALVGEIDGAAEDIREYASVEGKKVDYSVKKYCMSIINDVQKGEKLRNLCTVMLEYGAAAQEYFGYNTDNMANSDLSEEQKRAAAIDIATSNYTVISQNESLSQLQKSISFQAATLELKDNINILVKFRAQNGTNGVYFNVFTDLDQDGIRDDFEVSDLGPEIIEKRIAAAEESTDLYSVSISGIPAKSMRCRVEICALDEGGNKISDNLIYSIESYCNTQIKARSRSGNLCSWIMRYADAANSYFEQLK